MAQSTNHKQAASRAMLAVLMVLLTGAAAAGCSNASAGSDGAKIVTVARAATAEIDGKLEQEADIVASSQLNIISKLGGDVVEVLKKKGDNVNRGDVLFRLDASDMERNLEKTRLSGENLQAQLDKNAAELSTNKQVLRNTVEKLSLQIADIEKSYNSVRNDYDAGTATKAQVDKIETQWKAARLDLDTAQKQLAGLESTDPLAPLRIQLQSAELSMKDIEDTLADVEVKAPIGGILTELTPEPGMTVPQGFAAGVVQQLDPIKIHADVTDQAVKQLAGRKEVTFTLQGSADSFTGTVTYLADVMSPSSKTYVLELSAPNPDRKLKPGMRVKLQLGDDGNRQALTVPSAGIVKEGVDNYVFVLFGDHVEKRSVTLGRSSDNGREVLSGLKEGEQVVVSGQQGLKDQDKAVIRN
ncbi:efflux RND transporter periplasmic adaptor subunit [Paenibacillus validus]|uniref:Efflux RND transporter periplasmic adaptor subunit n=1 Tax=Paenibacillus validus TaxID=44253 RepID=A0A7X2ZCB0_9BACL|nr:efflux RND transporter periplasmic adaptor subunit [Paenibacillus validus]MUG71491.1 efflux RND transporter periplasmic adaptor subunit [Paenibacillus validus]